METVLIENKAERTAAEGNLAAGIDMRGSSKGSHDATIFELGIWLAGIDSFLSGGWHRRPASAEGKAPDMIKELRIVRAGLMRCSQMVFELISGFTGDSPSEIGDEAAKYLELSSGLRDAIYAVDALDRANSVPVAEWNVISGTLLTRLHSVEIYGHLTQMAEVVPTSSLARSVQRLQEMPNAGVRGDIYEVIVRFGGILSMLDIVGRMLTDDEPPKLAVLIFAAIEEKASRLVSYLNRRVERIRTDDEELAGTIDGAAYMAAIELKKVIQQELTGLTSVRSATGVFARSEAAYGTLTESFRQIIAHLATHIDQNASIFEMFPEYALKRDRSVVLQRELKNIAQLVRRAESDPSKENTNVLHPALLKFTTDYASFLFYKDIETVERFVEEILLTDSKQDIASILHRFGAYLETLMGQVNMRAVLAQQSF